MLYLKNGQRSTKITLKIWEISSDKQRISTFPLFFFISRKLLINNKSFISNKITLICEVNVVLKCQHEQRESVNFLHCRKVLWSDLNEIFFGQFDELIYLCVGQSLLRILNYQLDVQRQHWRFVYHRKNFRLCQLCEFLNLRYELFNVFLCLIFTRTIFQILNCL